MPITIPTVVVLGEHTLAYTTDSPNWFGVLVGDVWAGGYNWLNGPVVHTGKVRPATQADFTRFRVDSKGYLGD